MAMMKPQRGLGQAMLSTPVRRRGAQAPTGDFGPGGNLADPPPSQTPMTAAPSKLPMPQTPGLMNKPGMDRPGSPMAAPSAVGPSAVSNVSRPLGEMMMSPASASSATRPGANGGTELLRDIPMGEGAGISSAGQNGGVMGWDVPAPQNGNTGINGGGYHAPVGPTAAPSGNQSRQVGHDGRTAAGWNREQYRDKWMSSGAKTIGELQKWVAKNGGEIIDGAGRVRTPYGEVLDMMENARSGVGGRAIWSATGADAARVQQARQQSGGGGGVGGNGQQFSVGTNQQGAGAPRPGGVNAQMPGNFTYTPMQNLAAYQAGSPFSYGQTPQAQAVQAGEVNAAQMGQPGQIDAATVQQPGQLQGQQVDGPDALNAERFNLPPGFKAPTAKELEQDPSYRVRLQEGADALKADRAMAGVLRSGGVAKQLTQYGQEQASKEYGNVYARRMGEYQTSLGAAMQANAQNNQTAAQAYGLTNQYQQNAALANQQNAYQVGQANIANAQQAGMFNANQTQQANAQNVGNQMQAGQFNAGQQQQAGMFNAGNNLQAQQFNSQQQLQAQQQGYQQALGSYGMNQDNAYRAHAFNSQQALAQNAQQYGQAQGAWQGNVNAALGQGQLNLGYQQANNAYQLGQGNLQLGQGQLSLQQGAQNWMQNTQFPWQQQYQIAGLGFQAAQQQGQYAGQYGQAGSGAYYGQGNANAAGQIGAGNAWNNAFTNIGNNAQNAYAQWYQQQNPAAPNGLSPQGGV